MFFLTKKRYEESIRQAVEKKMAEKEKEFSLMRTLEEMRNDIWKTREEIDKRLLRLETSQQGSRGKHEKELPCRPEW